MMMEDNKNISDFLHQKNYKECIKLLKNKIIQYIVKLINENGIEYEYTNIIELIELSEKYINDERKNIAKKIEYFSFDEDESLCLDRLLEICKIYNIK